MKPQYFIQFYRFNPDAGGYVEAIASDGVAYMDGRWGMQRMHAEARNIGAARKHDGYRICRGTHTQPFHMTANVCPVRPETTIT